MHAPLQLVYILSLGHSGSTLLDLLLGSHSQVESGGEFFKFRHYMLDTGGRTEERRLCTCGAQVDECTYWTKVRETLLLRYGTFDFDLETDDPAAFEDNHYKVLRTILDVTGKSVFCDSSKTYTRLRRFVDSDLFRVHVIHLVRDGRAVGFSYKKKGHDFYRELRTWNRLNLHYHRELRSSGRASYRCLRYENLAADPHGELAALMSTIGMKFEQRQLRFQDLPHHNLSGNRMRMGGSSEIRRDASYLERLSRTEWMLGNLCALRGLRTFGYGMRKGGVPGG